MVSENSVYFCFRLERLLTEATAIIQSLSQEEKNQVDKSTVCKTVKTIGEKFVEKDIYEDELYLKSKNKAFNFLASLESKQYLAERN